MINWKHELGHQHIKKGALSYIISDEGTADLNGEEEAKQLADMVVFYKDHLDIIELKETTNTFRKAVSYRQIARYQHLRDAFKGKTEFWVYVYWNQYGYIVGTNMHTTDSLNFFAVKGEEDKLNFVVSVGTDEKTRYEKKVDYILKVKPGQIAPIKTVEEYEL